MTEAPVPTAPPPGPEIRLRRARLGDVPALVALYRGQSAEAKAYYHPFPFERWKLVPIFLWMVGTTPLVRAVLRVLPRRAAYVLVVSAATDDRPIGYGTIRFAVARGEETWAKFGYMVAEDRRGQGIGSILSIHQLRCARGLGMRRGGGYIVRENVASRTVVSRYGEPLVETAPDRNAPRGSVNLMSVGSLDSMIASYERTAHRDRPGSARLVGIDAHLAALTAPPPPAA